MPLSKLCIHVPPVLTFLAPHLAVATAMHGALRALQTRGLKFYFTLLPPKGFLRLALRSLTCSIAAASDASVLLPVRLRRPANNPIFPHYGARAQVHGGTASYAHS
jgi:hypothetical protein